ncbi:hypothetical protein GGI22_006823, partial [Coemansia erecta]
ETMNSPSLKYTMSWGASLASPVETTEPTTVPAMLPAPRRTTVHICVISAYNAAMEAAEFAASAGGGRSNGPQRASNSGLMIATSASGRRGSFSADLNSHSSITDSLASPSPHMLSPSPSDVAMFASTDPTPTPFSADYSLLNAAAAVAAADAVANLAALHQQHSQRHLPPNSGQSANTSRIRIEVEWISEGSTGGQQKTNRQSVEDAATWGVSGLGGGGGSQQQQQQQHQPGGIAMGLSTIHSLHGTAPNSPAILQPQHTTTQHQGASALTGYPFQSMSTSGSSLVTPLNAPPPAPTPLGHGNAAALNKGQSSKSRYVTKNGTVSGSEIWWKDESLFRVVNDPEISFMRVALIDDDVEVASACMSVDSLKEGYRYVELCENDKAAGFCRPIQVLIHVQMSQLHCLASPTMRL